MAYNLIIMINPRATHDNLSCTKQTSYEKKRGSKTWGHEVDFETFTEVDGKYTPWITKLNKHQGTKGQETSSLEVAFSDVALLFIKPGLTPPARIVKNDQKEVVGVASENFSVQIKK